jgi:hypothetical protein
MGRTRTAHRLRHETIRYIARKNGLPGKPSIDTLRKYIQRGIVSRATGKRIYLECEQAGGQLITSLEAWERFQDRLNGLLAGGEGRSPAAVRKDDAA